MGWISLCRGWVLFSGLREQLLAESPAQPLPIDVLNGKQFVNVTFTAKS